MTRAQLAELVDVNPQTVGALERGDHFPSLDLAFRICDVFGLPVEAVFSRTPFGPLSTELYRDPCHEEAKPMSSSTAQTDLTLIDPHPAIPQARPHVRPLAWITTRRACSH